MRAEADKISVVDDDDSMRQAIRELIESEGQRVEDFHSAEEFLCSGHFRDTSCLILDVRLPGMSGLELQSRMIAVGCLVPTIFISAHGDGYARDRALEAGAIDFLEKPFSDKALFNAINAALATHEGGKPEPLTRPG
jgi:FixJ family two-component response regulator